MKSLGAMQKITWDISKPNILHISFLQLCSNLNLLCKVSRKILIAEIYGVSLQFKQRDPLSQGSPNTGLWTSTGLRPTRNQAAQVSKASSAHAQDPGNA